MATELRLEYFKSLAKDGLIDKQGGIRAAQAVPKLYSVMLQADKLVTKAIMLNVLKYTQHSDIMAQFCQLGGWQLLNQWLTEAKADDNCALQHLLLQVFFRLPVTVDMLKANDTAKIVKQLAKNGRGQDLQRLAARVVDKWLECIKAEQPPKKEKKEKKRRKRRDSEESEGGRQRARSPPAPQPPRKRPSTVKTAPANFRDTNLLASDEVGAVPPSSSSVNASSSLSSPSAQSTAGGAKRRSGETSSSGDSSKEKRRRGQPQESAEAPGIDSMHSNVSVKTNELQLDSGFVDSIFLGGGGLGGEGGGVGGRLPNVPKLVRKKKKVSAPTSATTSTTTTPATTTTTMLTTAATTKTATTTTTATASLPTNSSAATLTKAEQQQQQQRRVRWAPEPDLEKVTYFELDETERVNVSRLSVEEMAKREYERERELLNKARQVQLHTGAPGSGIDTDMSTRDIARARVWYKPHRITGLPQPKHPPGHASAEREHQAKRQELQLQVIYFSKDSVPPSPAEPDVEHFELEEPKQIPLEDLSKLQPPPPQPQAPSKISGVAPVDAKPQQQQLPVNHSQQHQQLEIKTDSPPHAAASNASPDSPPSASTVASTNAVVTATITTTPSFSSPSLSSSSTAIATTAPTTTSIPTTVVSDLLTVQNSQAGGLALRDEVANMLKQVTRTLSTPQQQQLQSQPPPQAPPLQQPMPQQSQPQASVGGKPDTTSVKEMLWNLLRTRYPNLLVQTEDLTVDRIKQLLEPLKDELAASGMFPQIMAALFPRQQPPPPPPPQSSYRPPPHPGSQQQHRQQYPPFQHHHQQRQQFQPFQQQQQPHRFAGGGTRGPVPRGVCRFWYEGSQCVRKECRFRHQL